MLYGPVSRLSQRSTQHVVSSICHALQRNVWPAYRPCSTARCLAAYRPTHTLQRTVSAPSAAVKSIKKQHLVEVKSMPTPPAAVKLALESIRLLLGESATDWKQIRSVIVRENFISTIVNFVTDDIS